jgi:hypothetical protein
MYLLTEADNQMIGTDFLSKTPTILSHMYDVWLLLKLLPENQSSALLIHFHAQCDKMMEKVHNVTKIRTENNN